MWRCRGDGRQGCRCPGMEGCRGLGVTAGLGASFPAELSVAALSGGVPPPPPCAEPPQGLSVSHAWEQEGCQSPAGAARVQDGGNGAGSVTCSAGRGGGATRRETKVPVSTLPLENSTPQASTVPVCGSGPSWYGEDLVLGRGGELSSPLLS